MKPFILLTAIFMILAFPLAGQVEASKLWARGTDSNEKEVLVPLLYDLRPARPPVPLPSGSVTFAPAAGSAIRHLPFFCRQELKLEKHSGIPLRLRLGSMQHCDWLEQKAGTPEQR